MTEPIGFKPPEPPAPPRKWRFDIGNREGMIEETVKPNGFYLYDWIAVDGDFRFGILQSDHKYANEDVEAKARTRFKEPGLAANA